MIQEYELSFKPTEVIMAISHKERRQLDYLIDVLRKYVDNGRLAPELLLLQFEQITGVSRDAGSDGGALYSNAEKCRSAFERWYTVLGLPITVPLPMINDEEYHRFKEDQTLIYRPASSEVSYEAFMRAVGQDNHWTLDDDYEDGKIARSIVDHGYWFWADVSSEAPRCGQSREMIFADLSGGARKLMLLEEYAIVWWTAKTSQTGVILDHDTYTHLTNQYGDGHLLGHGTDGGIKIITTHNPNHAAKNTGGRTIAMVGH